MSTIIGLDAHRKQTVCTIQDETGQILAQGSVETTGEGLTRMLADRNAPEEATRVGLEPGAQSYWARPCSVFAKRFGNGVITFAPPRARSITREIDSAKYLLRSRGGLIGDTQPRVAAWRRPGSTTGHRDFAIPITEGTASSEAMARFEAFCVREAPSAHRQPGAQDPE